MFGLKASKLADLDTLATGKSTVDELGKATRDGNRPNLLL